MKILNLLAFILLTSMSVSCEQATEQELAPDSEFGLETLDSKSDSDVIRGDSPEAIAILEFSNQKLANNAEGAAFLELVDSRLYATAAKNIAKFRAGSDGEFGTDDDQIFEDLEALDAVPYVGPAALRDLLVLAHENGYPRALGVRDGLQKDHSEHTVLEYRPAREHMFSTIDNVDGWVEGVYTGLMVQTLGIPDYTIMNCEHTWPRSQLSRAGAVHAETDLHHLFPTSSFANTKRSSFPFGVVVSPIWEDGGSRLGHDLGGDIVFDVRPKHRGNVARAMFYVATVYGLEIPELEETTLRTWSEEDPVDAVEQARNSAIEAIQGNRNPFIDTPALVGQITDF